MLSKKVIFRERRFSTDSDNSFKSLQPPLEKGGRGGILREIQRKVAELKFFGYLADIAGARAKEVSLEKPVSLREILPPSFPEKNVIILINQKTARLDSLIHNEDRVSLMPVLSGG